MVPHHDVDVTQSLPPHRGAEVVLEKIPLVRRLEDARFPRLRRHRLVLDRDAPQRHARPAVLLDELRVVAGPRVSVFGAQVTAVQHVVVVLHERRRAPGTGEELQPVAARGHRPLDERDLVAQIVGDREGRQGRVALGDVRVALAREITAVDVGPTQGVPDPAIGAVIRRDHVVLPRGGQLGKRLGRGIGQRSADADHGLERFPRIDEDVDLSFRGRLRGLEHQGVGGRQPEAGAVGRGVNDRRSRGLECQHQASIFENRHAPSATNSTPTLSSTTTSSGTPKCVRPVKRPRTPSTPYVSGSTRVNAARTRGSPSSG